MERLTMRGTTTTAMLAELHQRDLLREAADRRWQSEAVRRRSTWSWPQAFSRLAGLAGRAASIGDELVDTRIDPRRLPRPVRYEQS
jgi:hypothetical protein